MFSDFVGFYFFFFNDTATTEIYTLSLHDALPISKRQVPFVEYGGLRFLEAAHVKDLLAVLRWADNPRNTLAAFRTLQLLPGMGPVNARAAIGQLEAGAHSFEALKAFSPPETAELEWRRLIELMESLRGAQRPPPRQPQPARGRCPAPL